VYPDRDVIAAVNAAFVPVRLDYRDPKVRELNIAWLPTVVILDPRGNEHARHVNASPPADFLDFLALGEAHARIKEGRTASHARAETVLQAALDRRDDGPFHPELLYWLAIAGYFRGNQDGAYRDRVWTDLRNRYSDSLWAHRIPEFLTGVAAGPHPLTPSPTAVGEGEC
jgi:hypothetical protein